MKKAQQFEWWVAKTGILIRDVEKSRHINPVVHLTQMTGITHRGMRVHFPSSFILRRATQQEIEMMDADTRAGAQEDRHILKKVSELHRKGFHVITG